MADQDARPPAEVRGKTSAASHACFTIADFYVPIDETRPCLFKITTYSDTYVSTFHHFPGAITQIPSYAKLCEYSLPPPLRSTE